MTDDQATRRSFNVLVEQSEESIEKILKAGGVTLRGPSKVKKQTERIGAI
jgi:hypothetical protein